MIDDFCEHCKIPNSTITRVDGISHTCCPDCFPHCPKRHKPYISTEK